MLNCERFILDLIYLLYFILFQIDPFGTVGDLSEEKKSSFSNISIPTFNELLTLVNETNMILMVDLHETSDWNPYYNKTIDIYMKEIKKIGIPQKRVSFSTCFLHFNM